MSKPKPVTSAPLALCLLLSLVVFVSAGALVMHRNYGKGLKVSLLSSQQKPTPSPKLGQARYIKPAMLWTSLREPFQLMAARLEKPGAERILLIGSLSRFKANNTQPASVRVILEQPQRLRIDEGNKITFFINNELNNNSGVVTENDIDEAEFILLDSPERLFTGLLAGNSLVQLGTRFRTDDGNSPNYQGAYYNIFEMGEAADLSKPNNDRASKVPTIRRYSLNADTSLLERMTYQRRRGNRIINVEVRFEDWRLVDKQQVPHLMTQLEEGRATLQFRVNTAALAPSANDGTFPLIPAN